MSQTEVQKVASHGSSTAAIFFLGGYPLSDDLASGQALSGFNERTINSFLKPIKKSLRECYRSVFIKEKLEYSGTNPTKLKRALEKINYHLYESILCEELREVQPTVIVPMDDISLAAVFPHINQIRKPKGRKYWINCYRGSILPLRLDWQIQMPTCRVIPTLSPQILQADYSARAYIQLDYNRIAINSLKRSAIEEVGLVWIAKTAKQVNNFFNRNINELAYRRVTVDVETWYGMLTCICFCFDGNESMSVPLVSDEISSGEMALMWISIAKVLASEYIEKEGQNFKYDWAILERHGFVVNNVIHDTNLKGRLIYPEFPGGLDFYTSIYTDMPYYKDEGKAYNDKLYTRDKLYLYNGKDGISTNQVGKGQDKDLEEDGLMDLYRSEIAPSIIIYKNMDETGILIDQQQRDKLHEKYNNHYEIQLKVLRARVGDDKFNPRSSDQVGKFVYEVLKYPARFKTDEETGKKTYKTDKDTLDDLLINHAEQNTMGRLGYVAISEIIMCKKLGTILQYIKTPLHPEGHWRGISNMAGAETGRTTSSKSIDERFRYENEPRGNDGKITKRLGRSLQTITKHGFSIDEEIFTGFEDRTIAQDIRSMFVPHRGFCFIECDGSQAEARVVAILADDMEMLAMFDQKPNIHKKTAAMIFKVDPNIIEKEKPYIPKIGTSYYHVGKISRHAGNNNMKAARLSQMSHIPIAETTRILEIFHSMHPNIRGVFHKQIRDCINNTRTLVNPNGRRRVFWGRLDEALINEAIGTIQQGTISDTTKFSMHRVVSAMSGYMKDYYFLNEAHDGVLTEVRIGREMEFANVFKKIYERPINFLNCSLSRNVDLVIPCEISRSDLNWMDLADPKNEIKI